MAVFTMMLQECIENYVGDRETFNAICLSEYPIFDESYRAELNKKIVDHYYLREIGQETVSMFMFTVKRKMNEIMPYYNQLYDSERLEYDPLFQMDYSTISSGDYSGVGSESSTSSSSSNSVTDSTGRTVNSDMPSVALSNVGNYASSAADSVAESKSVTDGSGDANSASESKSESSSSSRITGRSVDAPTLLARYRAILLNIDMMVVAELDDCFMGLWSNGDSTVQKEMFGVYSNWPYYY